MNSTSETSSTVIDEEVVITLRRPRRSRDEAEMDITPMIDVTFLLLIFFLVSSTPDRSTAIELPKALHGVGVSQLKAVLLTVGEGGQVYGADGRIPGTELSDDAETLQTQIRELVEEGVRESKTDVVIKADRNVAHRDVSRVIKAASQVDGIQIHLAVLETD